MLAQNTSRAPNMARPVEALNLAPKASNFVYFDYLFHKLTFKCGKNISTMEMPPIFFVPP